MIELFSQKNRAAFPLKLRKQKNCMSKESLSKYMEVNSYIYIFIFFLLFALLLKLLITIVEDLAG